jgi:RHS repeat-associated protein
LIHASDGTALANYDYGPFGEVIRATGPMAKLNPVREGSKFYDDETDLVYYGYRYYNPSTGRWVNRDPVAEQGGKNLYGYLGDDAVNHYDFLGLLDPGTCSTGVAVGATAAEAIAAVPAGAVILGTAVSAGAVYVTYQVCKTVCNNLFCNLRHPTWPNCGGPSDPQSAITQSGINPGWNLDGTPTVTASGPASPSACPSGGTWYSLTANYFTVIQTGTITYTYNISVVCCNCCKKYTSGQNCRVIHSQRGSGGQPPPPTGPPFQGPTYPPGSS